MKRSKILIGCKGAKCAARHQCENYSIFRDTGIAGLKRKKPKRNRRTKLLECEFYELDPTVEDLTPRTPRGEQMELF